MKNEIEKDKLIEIIKKVKKHLKEDINKFNEEIEDDENLIKEIEKLEVVL